MTANLELECQYSIFNLHHLLQILCYAKIVQPPYRSQPWPWPCYSYTPDPGDDSRVEKDVYSRRSG
eukprot:scaffold9681_cov103-Skeletonema_dohrnii-CCMP3373.AAC.2